MLLFRSLRCRGLHGGSSCGAIQRVRRTLKGEKGEGGRKGERTNMARGKGKRKRRKKERETGAMRLEQGGLDVGRPARARTTALGRFSSFYSFHLDWPPASSSRRGLPCLQPRPSVSSRICITTNVPITIAERTPGYRSRSFLDTVMLHSFYGPLV